MDWVAEALTLVEDRNSAEVAPFATILISWQNLWEQQKILDHFIHELRHSIQEIFYDTGKLVRGKEEASSMRDNVESTKLGSLHVTSDHQIAENYLSSRLFSLEQEIRHTYRIQINQQYSPKSVLSVSLFQDEQCYTKSNEDLAVLRDQLEQAKSEVQCQRKARLVIEHELNVLRAKLADYQK